MRRILKGVFFLIIMTFVSCAVNYEIVSKKEQSTAFSTHKSFAIIHDDQGFEMKTNPIDKHRIDRAIENELLQMGYLYSKTPDFEVRWFVTVDTKLESGVYNTYYSQWRSPKSIEVYEYTEGSLVVDIIDAKVGSIVWHATATGKIDDEVPDVDQKIKEVVKQIFKKYKKDTGIKKINAYAIK